MSLDSPSTYLLLILLMMAGSMIPRLVPWALLSNKEFSPKWKQALKFFGPCIIAAMLAKEIFFHDSSGIDLNLQNPFLLSSAVSFLIALRSKSLPIAVVAGVACMAWLRH